MASSSMNYPAVLAHIGNELSYLTGVSAAPSRDGHARLPGLGLAGSVLVERGVGGSAVRGGRQHVLHYGHRPYGDHDAHDDGDDQTGHGTLLLRGSMPGP